MDKRVVIAAYRRGWITIRECAQLLGLDTAQVAGVLSADRESGGGRRFNLRPKRHAHG
jgi:predicted transcriptional regulator of viral defense system